MTLDEYKSVLPIDRWRSLSRENREIIGSLVLEWLFAELVAQDDGLQTTEADRDEAQAIADAAFSEIDDAVEKAFPDVAWEYPEGTHYAVHDRRGRLIGNVLCPGDGFQFMPVRKSRPPGRKLRDGLPIDCLPAWARRVVDLGGSLHAVVPA